MNSLKNFVLFVCIAYAMSHCRVDSERSAESKASEKIDVYTTTPTNSEETLEKPYVILISIDGYRYDYTELYNPPNLLKFAEYGVVASSMIPSYPSKTFPNHYTIVTGLYPENHGIVSNEFYNPEKNRLFQMSDRSIVEDGSWYGGIPLWVLAEKQGMVAASYFWVGSEADIQGIRPSYYYNYDGSTPNEERVSQVINWLKLPEEERPHFITLYFSLVDHIGHDHGPETKEMEKAVLQIDSLIGQLNKSVEALELPVNIIIVSDHGMVEVEQENTIDIALYINIENYIFSSSMPKMFYLSDSAETDNLYDSLKALKSRIDIYKKNEIPAHLHFGDHPNIGDLIIIENPENIVVTGQRRPDPATHGFDPYAVEKMNGIFYAKGPHFRKGQNIPSFGNIHVFPLIAAILDLEYSHPIDGKLEALLPVLNDPALTRIGD